MTVDEIYQNIAQEMAFAASEENWDEAILHISVFEDSIEYEGEFTDVDGNSYIMDIENMDTSIANWIYELYNLMADSKNYWDEADVYLKSDGEFSIDFRTRE